MKTTSSTTGISTSSSLRRPAARPRGPEPASGRVPSSDGREETARERLDRNLDELNGELRVVITGVQVLFAFLLVVPFDSGFAGIGPFERAVYFITLLLAALATVCTIAPSAEHRFLFRHDDKRHIVFRANRVVIAGLVFLATAMCGALLLVATKLFGAAVGAITVGLAAVPFALLWFVLPVMRRARVAQEDPEEPFWGAPDDRMRRW